MNKPKEVTEDTFSYENTPLRITEDMFSLENTPLKTKKEADEIALTMPVCVFIIRHITEGGRIERSIHIKTHVVSKEHDIEETGEQYITNCLIPMPDGRYVSSVSGTFDTTEEAEKWVADIIMKVEETRKRIVDAVWQERGLKRKDAIVITDD